MNAVEIATLPLFEVGICFNYFVYRGNRSTKMNIGDMTIEATLTKIMYLLKNCSSCDELKHQIQPNIAGELSRLEGLV